ncbi:MAG: hypothetical protein ACOX0E_10080 [Syntrophomonadaceae bacterium]
MRVWALKLSLALWLIIVAVVADSSVACANNPIEHIILLSVDGLNYEGYMSVSTPNMIELYQQGAIDEKSLSLPVKSIEAAQASLLTGSFPEEHKIISSQDKPGVETLITVLNNEKHKTLFVDGSGGKLENLAEGSNYVKVDQNQDDSRVLELWKNFFIEERPFFSFLYLNDCRQSLLSVDEKAYFASIEAFDTQLDMVIETLQNTGGGGKTVIIVCSPGSSSPSHMCPLLIAGPNCQKKVRVSGTMILDLVPTVCFLTGLQVPYASRGIPLYGAFSNSLGESLDLNQLLLEGLQRERTSAWNKYFTLKNELELTRQEMQVLEQEKALMYNFTGEKDQVIIDLNMKIKTERKIFVSCLSVLLVGYIIQYLILRKKYMI